MTKRHLVKGLLISLLLIASNGYGAAFVAPASLINVPVPIQTQVGNLEIGMNSGITSLNEYQFDFALNYSVTEKLIVNAVMLNYETAVLGVHATFLDSKSFKNFSFSGGLLNITADPGISTNDSVRSLNSNQLVHFMMGSFDMFKGRMHVGLGKIRQNGLESEMTSLFTGFLLGYQKPLKKGEFMWDFDGAAMSFGMKRNLRNNKGHFKYALTLPMIAGEEGERTDLFNIQYTKKLNVFGRYGNELKNLQKEIEDFQRLQVEVKQSKNSLKKEVEALLAAKETLAKEVEKLRTRKKPKDGEDVDNNTERKEDAIKTSESYSSDSQAFTLFQDAQVMFSKGNYYKSIKKLKEAIELSPYEARFPLQLGSVYYKLKDTKKAYLYWGHAYKLDPTLLDFKNLPTSVLRKIKEEARKSGN